jgi:hypothetical protein
LYLRWFLKGDIMYILLEEGQYLLSTDQVFNPETKMWIPNYYVGQYNISMLPVQRKVDVQYSIRFKNFETRTICFETGVTT